MKLVLDGPRVHGAWVDRWWEGEARWSDAFGPHPDLGALRRVAEQLSAPEGWTRPLRPTAGEVTPAEALVVLAGQQPVLAGGPLLVIHKALTAVALARRLAAELDRPVVPVFLVATQDHDSSEVDHLDSIQPSNGHLLRERCPVQPTADMFCRSGWDEGSLRSINGRIRDLYDDHGVLPGDTWKPAPLAAHVNGLLAHVFRGTGLRLVEAHELSAPAVLDRALTRHEETRRHLREGAARLRALDLPPSFDAEDSRPLVLESRHGRRRRLEAADAEAGRARLARAPEDFSPHAALRPIVQAATLPVVAQVCGPSEIKYLGQARGLHEEHGVVAPVLVPRMEATRVPAEHLRADLFDERPAPAGEARTALLEAGADFAGRLGAEDPGLAPQLDRFLRKLRRDALRLDAAPSWRGRRRGLAELIRPRGRHQDAVLAWLPEWLQTGLPPADWVAHLENLCDPLAPPRHILHTPPGGPP